MRLNALNGVMFAKGWIMTPNMKFRTWTSRAWNNDVVPPLAKEPDMCPVHLYCNWSHTYSYITSRNVSRNHCYRLEKCFLLEVFTVTQILRFLAVKELYSHVSRFGELNGSFMLVRGSKPPFDAVLPRTIPFQFLNCLTRVCVRVCGACGGERWCESLLPTDLSVCKPPPW